MLGEVSTSDWLWEKGNLRKHETDRSLEICRINGYWLDRAIQIRNVQLPHPVNLYICPWLFIFFLPLAQIYNNFLSFYCKNILWEKIFHSSTHAFSHPQNVFVVRDLVKSICRRAFRVFLMWIYIIWPCRCYYVSQ